MAKIVYVAFSAPITGYTTEFFQSFLVDRLKEGATSFYVLLSSLGGNVKDGITLFNFLKSLPVELTMHNIGQVDSIANVVYAAGKKRYANHHSSFLFHGVGFTVSQGARLEEKDLQEKLDTVRKDQHMIASILNSEIGLPTETTEKFFFQTAVLSAEEGKKLGIVHDLQEAQVPEGAEFYQLLLQKA